MIRREADASSTGPGEAGGGSPQLYENPNLLRRGALVKAGDGLSIWWMGDDRITFPAVSGDTAGAYAFWVDEPPAGVGPPKHVHTREEEGFYVVEGAAEFIAGRVKTVLRQGDFVGLPKGVPHSWTNIAGYNAKLITFTAPGGNEGFFLELGADGCKPPGLRATLPVEEINRRTRRYGVTYMEAAPDPMEGALALGEGRNPSVVRAAEGVTVLADGVAYTLKAFGSAVAHAYCLVEAALPPGSAIAEHRHAAFEEGFYVLEGEIAASVDGDRFDAQTGDFVIVPWGLPHAVANESAEPARLLMISAPGGLEDYFRALGDQDAERSAPPKPTLGVFS